MRLKIDENLPTVLVTAFGDFGHDVDTVIDEQLLGASDPTVLQAATSEGRMLVTLDRGFGDVRSSLPGVIPAS